jgi:glutathione S-transferase
MELFIGNKNYSSWSLRAWLMLAKSGVKFSETKLALDTPGFYRALTSVTPIGKVPCIIDGDLHVWDSLAICEYINDAYLSGSAWPASLAERAKARALAAEMHSGFGGLRNEMPMNIRAKRYVELSDTAKKDIVRVDAIFAEQMSHYAGKGGWLFGEWSIVDAMYAPVVMRFQTYKTPLSAQAQRYVEHVLQCEHLQAWIAEALTETDIVDADEAGVEL